MWGRSAPKSGKEVLFFSCLCWESSGNSGKEGGREMGCETGVIWCWLWISSFSLVTQVGTSNCSTSSILVTCYPGFFPPSPHSLPIAELYISLTWLGWLLGVTLNGNAILSHLFCRGGCSAFRAKGLLLSQPIYTDAAINLNVLYPCTIPFMGGQEFTAKQHKDQIFDPVRQNL